MLTYLGSGFIAGIPARDLDDMEAETFGANNLILSGLYAQAQPETEEPAEPETDEPETEEE